MKIYCEHGALSSDLRQLQVERRVELVQFPYDLNSRSRHLSTDVTPSRAQWRDMNLPWDEIQGTWQDLDGSDRYHEILATLGKDNRRDALHVDSAYKSGCSGIVSRDSDIVDIGTELHELIGIRVFHPDRDAAELRKYILGGDA